MVCLSFRWVNNRLLSNEAADDDADVEQQTGVQKVAAEKSGKLLSKFDF